MFSVRVKECQESAEYRQLYAKKNCKTCFGKGTVHRSLHTGTAFVDRNELCICIHKNIQKEIDELRNNIASIK